MAGVGREPTDDEVGLNEPPADPLNDMDPDGGGDSDDSINYNDIIIFCRTSRSDSEGRHIVL